MQQSGFRSAPLSQILLSSLVVLSLLATIAGVKHHFHIQIIPHLFVYRQFWRVLIFQSCYANAGELLFGSLVIYHLRVIERLFGTRKYASFLAYVFASTSLLTPLLLAAVFRPVTLGVMNYIPPGPTPVIFAALAQYHALVPGVYRLRLLSPSAEGGWDGPEVTVSDKLYVYLMCVQLALCQPPGSVLSAAVGWVVGSAWRMDLLPRSRWRAPGWLFKEDPGVEFEMLRRRLRDGESVAEDNPPTAGPVPSSPPRD